MTAEQLASAEPRFWPKVEQTDGCWLWNGATDSSGYGHLRVSPSSVAKAHRVSYLLAHGELPDGTLVLHRCDNPPCVNPAHLFLGSNADNRRDCMAKGRVGGKVPGRLRDEAVLEIEAGRATQTAVAARFGINQSAVSRWVQRRRMIASQEASHAA